MRFASVRWTGRLGRAHDQPNQTGKGEGRGTSASVGALQRTELIVLNVVRLRGSERRSEPMGKVRESKCSVTLRSPPSPAECPLRTSRKDRWSADLEHWTERCTILCGSPDPLPRVIWSRLVLPPSRCARLCQSTSAIDPLEKNGRAGTDHGQSGWLAHNQMASVDWLND